LKYLLDSVVLIDHLNGRESATRFLMENGSACAISVITRAEVLVGGDEESEYDVLRLLDRFVTLPVTVEVADVAARLRRTHRWKLPDTLQAAVAKLADLTIVTRDAGAFNGVEGLSVLRL
jgi:predicted nucleic acid-binding protein